MNIKEKSREYAQGKALDAITAAIEQAYTDGYVAGYNDGASANNTDNKNVVMIEGVEYVDLGLKSKTLWAKDYLRDSKNNILHLNYYEAEKLWSIPSVNQFEELDNHCKKELITDNKGVVHGIRYRSLSNNAYIDLSYSYGIINKSISPLDSFAFWLDSCGYIDSGFGRFASIKGCTSLKAEIALPVILVKKAK